MTESPINVVLVDDHAILRTGFRLLIENSNDIRVIAELDSGEAINQKVLELKPDVIVMDLSMPGMGGLEAIRRIKAKNPAIKILVFTMHDSTAFVEQALEAGAKGYITKNNAPKVLLEVIRKIFGGGTYIDEKLADRLSMKENIGSGKPLGNLSRREFQIFCKFAEGRNANEIAEDLSLSVKTVANYQTQIKEKLGITSTADLVKLAIANGIIQM